MKIQIPNNCIFYKRHENMNKTCIFAGIEKMCKIYHDEVCSEYKEKEDETSKSDSVLYDCSGCVDSDDVGDD